MTDVKYFITKQPTHNQYQRMASQECNGFTQQRSSTKTISLFSPFQPLFV